MMMMTNNDNDDDYDYDNCDQGWIQDFLIGGSNLQREFNLLFLPDNSSIPPPPPPTNPEEFRAHYTSQT